VSETALIHFHLKDPVHRKTNKGGKFIYLYTTVYVFWASPRLHIPIFPPELFLYVNLGAKAAQKLFKTLAPQLTVLGIPHFP
jgi:hypothetical protein